MLARTLAPLLFLAACGGSDTLTQPEPPPVPPEPAADAAAAAETPAAKAATTDADGGMAAHAHPEGEGDGEGEGEGAFAAAPEGASVSFGSPEDGATVSSPVALTFQVEGMTIQPAGTLTEGTGHHHVIVDGQGIAAGEAVPADETHIHFGKGQTETSLELSPGTHTLTLQFADGAHRSYGPDLSATISVVVEAPAE